MKRTIFLATVLTGGVALPAQAAADWIIVADESKLTLTGELEGQDTEVDLEGLTGDIIFDPADLPGSRVRIAVDLTNITAGYDEIIKTLSSSPWFDIGTFPSAVFTSQSITKRPDGRYTAEGTLALKGASKPVTVVFSYESRGAAPGKPDVERATAEGEAVIDRTAFAVGEDAWGKSVAEDVRVTFTVVAERHPAP